VTLPRLLLVLLAFACTVLGVGVVALSERAERKGPEDAPAFASITEGPVAVLREWDRRRAEAWAAGDADALRSLYTRRSTAGVRDVALLSRWLARGLRVHRMQTQVLNLQVVEQHAGRLVLMATDRITRAVATGRGTDMPLPVDSPSTWRITMRRVAGEWRVAAVRR